MQLAVWLAMAVALLATVPEAEAPQREEPDYSLAMLDLAEAFKRKSPEAMSRTIFAFGGSHLAYGLDSAQFSDAGFALANLGLNMSVGAAFPMHQIDQIRSAHPPSSPPAAIIMSPVLPQIIEEGSHGEALALVLSAMKGGARWAWGFEGLPLWLQVKAKAAQVWLKHLKNKLNPAEPERPQPIRGQLHRDILTGAGTIDSAYIRRDTVPQFLHTYRALEPSPRAPEMAAWARKQNVPIFILPQPFSAPVDSAVAASLGRTYEQLAADCGGRLLLPMHQAILDSSLFLEGVHLNLAGREIWTQRIVDACHKNLSPFELP